MTMNTKIIDWFIPEAIRQRRTAREMARTFVFTHLFGPLIAQPMCIYLFIASPQGKVGLFVLAASICSFWALPFVLRATGDIALVALISFQGLAMTSLYGAYHYGGFSSPFMPWLAVSLLLGIFYLSKRIWLVLALFALDVGVFLALAAVRPFPERISTESLAIMGWLSIGAATLYMTWMALYYSSVVGLRSELEVEAVRGRALSTELERARAAAEEHGRARAQFFAKMNHELRTPLNSIIGYSEILLDELQDSPEANTGCAQDVLRINTAGKHLLSLVAKVLDGDAPDPEAIVVNPALVRIGTLCDEAIASTLPLIEKNGNRLIVDCPQADRHIQTDAKMLRQIIINLLGNAGKFTSEGEVTLKIFVEVGPHDDHLQVVVQDTGIGISADRIASIFEDYRQGGPSVRTAFGGTGLGLALSRVLCLSLGGQISVLSEPGQGSTFTMTVPASLSLEEETKRQGYSEAN
ncbi:sensor histidine kinase [Pseudorhodobacter turbinis]|nr:HAMP domain-containing sensor histidine kinase [Pseudorhodobacter turbinis]